MVSTLNDLLFKRSGVFGSIIVQIYRGLF